MGMFVDWSSMFGLTGETVAANGQNVPLTPGQEAAGVVTPQSTSDYVSTALKQAMPQILGMTQNKGGSRAPSAPSAGRAGGTGGGGASGSGMQVVDAIGESANNNPLGDIQKWGNLF